MFDWIPGAADRADDLVRRMGRRNWGFYLSSGGIILKDGDQDVWFTGVEQARAWLQRNGKAPADYTAVDRNYLPIEGIRL